MSWQDQRESPLVVAQGISTWLPQTMTWVYTLLNNLPSISSVVLAETTQNLSQFPWPSLYAQNSKLSSLPFRFLRKAGIRSYPYLFDRVVQKHRPTLLHSHFGDTAWQLLPLAKRHGMKHIVTFYGYDVNMLPRQNPAWRDRYQELFCQADIFLCEGEHMASCLVQLGCPPEKVVVQRLGVEVERIPFSPRHPTPSGEIRVLIAGTFREKKGIPYALEALGRLRSKFSGLRITIIGDSTGQGREIQEKSRIEEIIRIYDLTPVIRMLGFQPHDVFLNEAQNHHIFLSPSVTASDGDTEGGAPVTLIETAASGMLLISSRHCDIPGIVQDGKTGWLADERDIDGLVDCLERALTYPEAWGAMQLAARQLIETEFNASTQGERLANIYRNLSSPQSLRKAVS